jgi:dTDP-4-dehydrorhamnose 3,5-epimerase
VRIFETPLDGCVLIELEPHVDDRGFFARTWCAREFAKAGLPDRLVQCSISRNSAAGTTRGLHFQAPPSREGKIVRCARGALVDVVVDIRSESPTFLQHLSIELDEHSGRGIYVAPGLAHGFQTQRDDTDVLYHMTDYFAPELAAGLRWDDPALGIRWPGTPTNISERDAGYPDLDTGWLQSLKWD